MNVLTIFEQRIGAILEGGAPGEKPPFSFKRLARRAVREMEDETFVIDGVDTAPALYTILVSSADDAMMRSMYLQITDEISQLIEAQAKKRGYTFVGRPLVRFMVDPALRHGKISVFAENIDPRTLARLRDEENAYLGINPPHEMYAQPFTPSPVPVHEDEPAPVAQEAAFAAKVAPEVVAGIAPQNAEETGDVPINFDLYDDGMGVFSKSEGELLANAQAVAAAMDENAALASLAVSDSSASMEMGSVESVETIDAAAEPIVAEEPVAPVASEPVPEPQAPVVPEPVAPQPEPQPVPEPEPQPAVVAPVVTAARAAAAKPSVFKHAPERVASTCTLVDLGSGRVHYIDTDYMPIGRERTSGGIVLADPNVSRRHAELLYDGAVWHIHDLNSTNGTLVNDVDVREAQLFNGDVLTIGLTNLEFRVG